MTHVISGKQIAAGYALAVVALAGGLLLSLKMGGAVALPAMIAGYVLSAILILVSTFAWGRRRGYVIRNDEGRISLTNLTRNLVMTAIACAAVLVVVGQIVFRVIR